jgi:transcription elongation factor Elf1
MKTYFKWTCPDCGHLHESETVDAELGPFMALVCDDCGSISDENNLQKADVEAWSVAVNRVC